MIDERNSGASELAILGIDVAQGLPSLSNFPQGFNKQAFYIWEDILNSAEFRYRSKGRTNYQVWRTMIHTYFRECQVLGEFPFRTAIQQHRNDIVASFMQRSRRRVTKFFNDSEFFTRATPRRARRSYRFTKSEFILEASLTLWSFDPTFRQWLTTSPLPRFVNTGSSPNHKFERELFSPAIKVWVDFRNNQEATVGYTITCGTVPAWPSMTKPPTSLQLEEFVERTFWVPAVRANRIEGINNKFF